MSDPSFQDIVNGMVTYLQQNNSPITDFTPTSVALQFFSAVAAQIDMVYSKVDTAEAQANISSASGTGLDAKGQDLAVPRKVATPAIWYFQFKKNVVSSQQIPIAQGSIITTIPGPGQAPVTFATNAASYLPAGTNTVLVAATCQTAGSIGNIAPNTPLLIGSALPGIDSVSLPSTDNGTYGADVESDSAYQKRLLNALASKAQSTAAWYQATAMSVAGVISAKVNPQGRGPGTVDIYIVGQGNTIPAASIVNACQAAIDAGRVITDDAKVFTPTLYQVNETITVKIDPTYDLAQTKTQIQTAVTNYINGLGIGGGSIGWLYQAQVNAVALGVAGTLNIIPPATPAPDIQFSAFQLPQAGTITIITTH